MNPLRRSLLSWIVWLLMGASSLAAPSEKKHSRHDLKVQKVYAVQDGPYVFRAYGVEWNGQEAVVEDRLAMTNYRTDDMITVLVMKLPHPSPVASHGLLNFAIVPPRGGTTAPPGPVTGVGPAAKLPPSRQNLRVLKVISVEDEGYVHRSYVVSWNGEDVIANDPLVAT